MPSTSSRIDDSALRISRSVEATARRTSSANKWYRGWRTGPVARNLASPPSTPPSVATSRVMASAATRSGVSSRGVGRTARSRIGPATRRRSSSPARPARSCRSPSSANTIATAVSSRATARQMRRARSSASSVSRSASVSSAIPKPGSSPASRGNSRSSDRQKASIVLIATSDRCSRSIFHRRGSMPPCSAECLSVARIRSRISAAALRVKVIARMCRGSTPARTRLT